MRSKTARRVHFALAVLWTVVGLPLSIWLRYSIPWLVFLSVYAIIATHWSGWSAERPVTIEVDETDRILLILAVLGLIVWGIVSLAHHMDRKTCHSFGRQSNHVVKAVRLAGDVDITCMVRQPDGTYIPQDQLRGVK